jgi:putative flippase GtrA
MTGWTRWLKFNAVGALGIVVQLGVLALLTGVFQVQYLIATAIAVESAVLHNFAWHERFTWADRRGSERLCRLLKFNATTGAFSIAGNVIFSKLLGEQAGGTSANICGIGLCSVINFLLNDRLVFVRNVETLCLARPRGDVASNVSTYEAG